MEMQVGADSLQLPRPVYIMQTASVVGKLEGEGPIGDCFDMVCADDRFGSDSWESAESEMQKEALTLALGKEGLQAEQVRYLFAGDLLDRILRPHLVSLTFPGRFSGCMGHVPPLVRHCHWHP